LLTSRPPAGSLLRIPVFGTIPAGFPRGGGGQEADSFISIAADTLHVPSGAHTFALRVRRDSMTGAGILDGDSIILEFRDPHHGDIVAALIDGETTLKRYLVRRGLPYLRAENPRYPDLIPARELVVQGVMVALLRVPHAVPRLRP
ncbi:MAG: repressor LexA, partial [Verrucomicrobiaceae bacterium]